MNWNRKKTQLDHFNIFKIYWNFTKHNVPNNKKDTIKLIYVNKKLHCVLQKGDKRLTNNTKFVINSSNRN